MTTTNVATEAPPRTRRPSIFERLAEWSQRHRWWALAAWVLVLATVTVGSQAVGPSYHNNFSLPGTDSQRALQLLEERAPAQSGTSVQIVLQAPGGMSDPDVRTRIDAMLAEVQRLPHVVSVRGPYDDPSAISPDGTIGYATVALDEQSEDIPVEDGKAHIDTAQRAEQDGVLRVELSGDPIRAAQETSGGAAEGLGLLAALIILIALFGSLLAAGLPVVIAVFAVGSTLGLIVFASHFATIADFTPPLMMLVGLGVGIDYALLIFSRYRSELVAGADSPTAVRKALDTAGRTVFFAGCTVIVALLGLVVLGLGSLQGVAVAIALTVLMTMLASLTLLPSLLSIAGGRLERRVRKRIDKRGVRPEGRHWARWTAAVQRHAWLGTLVPFAFLIALTVPASNLYLGFADPGTDPATSTTRQAYDLLAEGFGPGFNGPLIVVVEGGQAAATVAQQALSGTEGVALAAPPFAAEGGGISTILVFPASAPQDEATSELVKHLRDDVLPPVAGSTGATFLVGGSMAAAEDFAGAVADRLPIFVLVVVGLSMLLLLLVFRSILIPIKAAVLNLLSVGASMGVLTLVFQAGNLGVQPGPIEAYVPVMVFAIVFGLSMDYEVFLLARMHEEWQRSQDATMAIRQGIATTGRVVTAAAAIMIVVFGAFMLSGTRMLEQFGLGLAVAVFLDAVVIRCLLLPAMMQLLGRRAWWLPRPLARILPRVAIERS